MKTTFKLMPSLLLLALSLLATSNANKPPSTSISNWGKQTAVSRIPRGGGWFNRNNNNNKGGDGNSKNKTRKRYPGLTQEEIEAKLNIPVFAITDSNGNSVIARNKTDGEDVQYLFFSQKMAQHALQQLMGSGTVPDGLQLKLMPLHLGKLWFRYLHNNNSDETVNKQNSFRVRPLSAQPPPQADQQKNATISFRLVPDTRNLISARLMSCINPEEMKQKMEEHNVEQVQELIQWGIENAKNFTGAFNDIPLFMIPTMRAQSKHPMNTENVNVNTNAPQQPPQLVMPIFLGARDLIQAFTERQQRDNHPLDLTQTTTVSVTSLHQLVQLMQEESDFDFRSIVILPLIEDTNTNGDKDDDDNDGGGGDFGISTGEKEEDEEMEQPQIEMFTEFGTSWDQEDSNEGYYQELLSTTGL